MKKLVFAFLFIPCVGWSAYQPISGSTITASQMIQLPVTGTFKSATDVVSVSYPSNYANAGFTIWPGTVTGLSVVFETSADSGTTWQGVLAVQNNANVITSAFTVGTATTTWNANIDGTSNFRIRATAWSTGFSSATITVGAFASVPNTSVTGSSVSAAQYGVYQVEPGTNTFKAALQSAIPAGTNNIGYVNINGTPTVTLNGTQNVNVVNNSTVSVVNSTIPVISAIIPPVTGIINSATSIIASTFTPVYENASFTIWPGTATGVTVVFEASADSATSWQSIDAVQDNDNRMGTTYTVGTATTTWDAEIAGMTNFRVRATAWTNGFSSVTISIQSMPTSPAVNVTGSTVSVLGTFTTTAVTTATYSGTGFAPIGATVGIRVASTTLPTIANDGAAIPMMGTNIGQQVVSGMPWGLIQTTYSVTISSSQAGTGNSTGETPLVIGTGVSTFTYLCDCAFSNTTPNQGQIILESPAASTTNRYVVQTSTVVPQSNVGFGCTDPFFRSASSSNIYIFQTLAVARQNVNVRCRYYQGP